MYCAETLNASGNSQNFPLKLCEMHSDSWNTADEESVAIYVEIKKLYEYCKTSQSQLFSTDFASGPRFYIDHQVLS